jgi:hypothetical protein
MWASLSWKQKVAGIGFCVGKLHSIMAAITMMVSRRMGGICLVVAGLGVGVAVMFSAWDSYEKKRRVCRLSDEQIRRIIENDETVRNIVEARSKELAS